MKPARRPKGSRLRIADALGGSGRDDAAPAIACHNGAKPLIGRRRSSNNKYRSPDTGILGRDAPYTRCQSDVAATAVDPWQGYFKHDV
jgi:hypothetical protein